jgi:hypothetical protein
MSNVPIEIVVGMDAGRAGEKSLFDAAARVLAPITANTSDVTHNLTVFCQAFASGIEGAANALAHYELDKIEMTIELNAKGQVRLIASASAELKGGIKLVFARKP